MMHLLDIIDGPILLYRSLLTLTGWLYKFLNDATDLTENHMCQVRDDAFYLSPSPNHLTVTQAYFSFKYPFIVLQNVFYLSSFHLVFSASVTVFIDAA